MTRIEAASADWHAGCPCQGEEFTASPSISKGIPMRSLIVSSALVLCFAFGGCTVKVEEKPTPVIKQDRDVDVKVDAPGVDVKVKRDK
jgi:hypothetical protein